MTDIIYRRATLEHASELAPLLRQADVAEVLASHDADGETVLREGVATSEHAVAMFLGGEIAAIFGLAFRPSTRLSALGPRFDCVWFLTGRAVDRYPISFIKGGRRIFAAFRRISPRLYNWVDVRYVAAVRLVESFGATLGPPVPHGKNGELFRLVLIEEG